MLKEKIIILENEIKYLKSKSSILQFYNIFDQVSILPINNDILEHNFSSKKLVLNKKINSQFIEPESSMNLNMIKENKLNFDDSDGFFSKLRFSELKEETFSNIE